VKGGLGRRVTAFDPLTHALIAVTIAPMPAHAGPRTIPHEYHNHPLRGRSHSLRPPPSGLRPTPILPAMRRGQDKGRKHRTRGAGLPSDGRWGLGRRKFRHRPADTAGEAPATLANPAGGSLRWANGQNFLIPGIMSRFMMRIGTTCSGGSSCPARSSGISSQDTSPCCGRRIRQRRIGRHHHRVDNHAFLVRRSYCKPHHRGHVPLPLTTASPGAFP